MLCTLPPHLLSSLPLTSSCAPQTVFIPPLESCSSRLQKQTVHHALCGIRWLRACVKWEDSAEVLSE